MVNANPGLTLTPKEIHAIVADINNARRNTNPRAANMRMVQWNDALYTELQKFVAENGPEWFWEYNEQTTYFNGFTLMSLQPFNTEFPGFNLMFKDATQSKLKNAVLNIIKFRINQKPCIEYSQCSTTEFTDYETCLNPNPPPKKNCNWANQYYPLMTDATLENFACVPIAAVAPYTKPPKNMSFWCYGLYQSQTNDQPYISGAPCSACPEDAPECQNGLCVPKSSSTLKP